VAADAVENDIKHNSADAAYRIFSRIWELSHCLCRSGNHQSRQS